MTLGEVVASIAYGISRGRRPECATRVIVPLVRAGPSRPHVSLDSISSRICPGDRFSRTFDRAHLARIQHQHVRDDAVSWAEDRRLTVLVPDVDVAPRDRDLDLRGGERGVNAHHELTLH